MSSIIWLLIVFLGIAMTSPNMITLLCILGVSLSFLAIVLQCQQYIRVVLLALRLPGPPACPIIGHSYLAFNNEYLFSLANNARNDYGPIIRAWAAIFPVIFILEPRHIEKVLLSSKNVRKMHFYRWMHNFLGDGLVTSEANVWRRHRRLIQPALSVSNIEVYVPAIHRGAESLLHCFDRSIQENKQDNFNITSSVNSAVFGILHEIVFGTTVDENEPASDSCTTTFRRGKLNFQDRLFSPWLMIDAVYKISQKGREDEKQRVNLRTSVMKMISERKAQGILEKDCLLNHFLSLKLTEEECVGEVTTFMLAGQDTIASAFSFALYCFAKHQDVQDKASIEVKEILGSSIEVPNIKDIEELLYLDQCIKETLRLFPSVAVFGRTLSNDIDLDGIILPAGTDVAITPYVTHRLPVYFPDPEKFDPDRFNLRNTANRVSCAFIPFSAGPRNCIGKKLAMIELKILLATTLQKYHVSLPRMKDRLSLKYRVTLRASGGVWINFRNREETA